MAATEGKAAAKDAPKEVVEETLAPLRGKTWVLKVSIHCEGCKRKVKKVLLDIEGVYKVDVDLRQQKAVVIGNVEAETLIKRLLKTGKHAELWPEKADSKEKKRSKGKKKEKQIEQESSEESNHADDKEKGTVKVEVQDPAKNGGGGCHSNVISEGGKTGGQAKEPKPEVKQNVTVAAGSQSPVPEQKGAGDGENGNEKSGSGGGGGGGGGASGSGGKKKKKKGQKATVNTDDSGHPGAAPPPGSGSPNHGHGQHGHGYGHDHQGPLMTQIPAADNHSHTPQHVYHHQYPPQYQPHYDAQPVYATSYSRAHPFSSHVTHYSSPPPYLHTYVQHPVHDTEPEHPPSEYYYDSHPPASSFELFSDENPNGCSVM
ncbi:hypothetical protein FH972_006623 [Carpinus fangiana]|uniref:HMA domain-containing protein n=1 Tax=Carpinus fangiana TaxID=176857 RepID=A0A5N6QT20_9ROSI|nr:hypothetical protein FH972_006623 [Carpinus fangiana]